MVEPVTTATAAAAAANGTATAAGAAGAASATGAAVPPISDGGFLSGITDIFTAPVKWLTSLPGKIFGTFTGAVKGIFNFGNLPVAAVVAGVETLITVSAPEIAVEARKLAGMSDEEARKAVADIAKDGITGVAMNSLLHGAVVAGGLGAASGASEGAGGGFSGMLAGVGVVASGIALANHFMNAPATPVTDSKATAKADVQKA